MISGGMEVDQFAGNRLTLEEKFGENLLVKCFPMLQKALDLRGKIVLNGDKLIVMKLKAKKLNII